MANPNPVQTEELKSKWFARQGEIEGKLSSKVRGIRLPEEIEVVVSELDEPAAWMRRVIVEAAQRELMNTENGK